MLTVKKTVAKVLTQPSPEWRLVENRVQEELDACTEVFTDGVEQLWNDLWDAMPKNPYGIGVLPTTLTLFSSAKNMDPPAEKVVQEIVSIIQSQPQRLWEDSKVMTFMLGAWVAARSRQQQPRRFFEVVSRETQADVNAVADAIFDAAGSDLPRLKLFAAMTQTWDFRPSHVSFKGDLAAALVTDTTLKKGEDIADFPTSMFQTTAVSTLSMVYALLVQYYQIDATTTLCVSFETAGAFMTYLIPEEVKDKSAVSEEKPKLARSKNPVATQAAEAGKKRSGDFPSMAKPVFAFLADPDDRRLMLLPVYVPGHYVTVGMWWEEATLQVCYLDSHAWNENDRPAKDVIMNAMTTQLALFPGVQLGIAVKTYSRQSTLQQEAAECGAIVLATLCELATAPEATPGERVNAHITAVNKQRQDSGDVKIVSKRAMERLRPVFSQMGGVRAVSWYPQLSFAQKLRAALSSGNDAWPQGLLTDTESLLTACLSRLQVPGPLSALGERLVDAYLDVVSLDKPPRNYNSQYAEVRPWIPFPRLLTNSFACAAFVIARLVKQEPISPRLARWTLVWETLLGTVDAIVQWNVYKPLTTAAAVLTEYWTELSQAAALILAADSDLGSKLRFQFYPPFWATTAFAKQKKKNTDVVAAANDVVGAAYYASSIDKTNNKFRAHRNVLLAIYPNDVMPLLSPTRDTEDDLVARYFALQWTPPGLKQVLSKVPSGLKDLPRVQPLSAAFANAVKAVVREAFFTAAAATYVGRNVPAEQVAPFSFSKVKADFQNGQTSSWALVARIFSAVKDAPAPAAGAPVPTKKPARPTEEAAKPRLPLPAAAVVVPARSERERAADVRPPESTAETAETAEMAETSPGGAKKDARRQENQAAAPPQSLTTDRAAAKAAEESKAFEEIMLAIRQGLQNKELSQEVPEFANASPETATFAAFVFAADFVVNAAFDPRVVDPVIGDPLLQWTLDPQLSPLAKSVLAESANKRRLADLKDVVAVLMYLPVLQDVPESVRDSLRKMKEAAPGDEKEKLRIETARFEAREKLRILGTLLTDVQKALPRYRALLKDMTGGPKSIEDLQAEISNFDLRVFLTENVEPLPPGQAPKYPPPKAEDKRPTGIPQAPPPPPPPGSSGIPQAPPPPGPAAASGPPAAPQKAPPQQAVAPAPAAGPQAVSPAPAAKPQAPPKQAVSPVPVPVPAPEPTPTPPPVPQPDSAASVRFAIERATELLKTPAPRPVALAAATEEITVALTTMKTRAAPTDADSLEIWWLWQLDLTRQVDAISELERTTVAAYRQAEADFQQAVKDVERSLPPTAELSKEQRETLVNLRLFAADRNTVEQAAVTAFETRASVAKMWYTRHIREAKDTTTKLGSYVDPRVTAEDVITVLGLRAFFSLLPTDLKRDDGALVDAALENVSYDVLAQSVFAIENGKISLWLRANKPEHLEELRRRIKDITARVELLRVRRDAVTGVLQAIRDSPLGRVLLAIGEGRNVHDTGSAAENITARAALLLYKTSTATNGFDSFATISRQNWDKLAAEVAATLQQLQNVKIVVLDNSALWQEWQTNPSSRNAVFQSVIPKLWRDIAAQTTEPLASAYRFMSTLQGAIVWVADVDDLCATLTGNRNWTTGFADLPTKTERGQGTLATLSALVMTVRPAVAFLDTKTVVDGLPDLRGMQRYAMGSRNMTALAEALYSYIVKPEFAAKPFIRALDALQRADPAVEWTTVAEYFETPAERAAALQWVTTPGAFNAVVEETAKELALFVKEYDAVLNAVSTTLLERQRVSKKTSAVTVLDKNAVKQLAESTTELQRLAKEIHKRRVLDQPYALYALQEAFARALSPALKDLRALNTDAVKQYRAEVGQLDQMVQNIFNLLEYKAGSRKSERVPDRFLAAWEKAAVLRVAEFGTGAVHEYRFVDVGLAFSESLEASFPDAVKENISSNDALETIADLTQELARLDELEVHAIPVVLNAVRDSEWLLRNGRFFAGDAEPWDRFGAELTQAVREFAAKSLASAKLFTICHFVKERPTESITPVLARLPPTPGDFFGDLKRPPEQSGLIIDAELLDVRTYLQKAVQTSEEDFLAYCRAVADQVNQAKALVTASSVETFITPGRVLNLALPISKRAESLQNVAAPPVVDARVSAAVALCRAFLERYRDAAAVFQTPLANYDAAVAAAAGLYAHVERVNAIALAEQQQQQQQPSDADITLEDLIAAATAAENLQTTLTEVNEQEIAELGPLTTLTLEAYERYLDGHTRDQLMRAAVEKLGNKALSRVFAAAAPGARSLVVQLEQGETEDAAADVVKQAVTDMTRSLGAVWASFDELRSEVVALRWRTYPANAAEGGSREFIRRQLAAVAESRTVAAYEDRGDETRPPWLESDRDTPGAAESRELFGGSEKRAPTLVDKVRAATVYSARAREQAVRVEHERLEYMALMADQRARIRAEREHQYLERERARKRVSGST